jgi:hypothetical protein
VDYGFRQCGTLAGSAIVGLKLGLRQGPSVGYFAGGSAAAADEDRAASMVTGPANSKLELYHSNCTA